MRSPPRVGVRNSRDQREGTEPFAGRGVSRAMLELLLAALIGGWALIARGRGQTAVAAGAVTMAAVLSAGGLASVMDLMPWLEGVQRGRRVLTTRRIEPDRPQ